MKFSTWFEKQYGKRPAWSGYTDQQLIDMMRTGDMARAYYTAAIQWDEKCEAAKYAWCCSDAYKKKPKSQP